MVYDVFDCTFECVGNHLCFSVNLAATKGIDGRLWCELMSSDKYRNLTQLKGNKSAHHFFIEVQTIFKHKSFQLKCLCREFNLLLTSFSSFCSVLVVLHLVKTEASVRQSIKMTRLNVSVRQASLENIATKSVSVTLS